METILLPLMGVFIIASNIIAFFIFKKKKNLYLSAFTILILAFVLGGFGGVLALFILNDAFAIFYGFQLGYYLIINSLIVFLLAIVVTVIRKWKRPII
ncbi:3-isopropylmalate dehydrogenase [Bacillus massiliigorillae]|uniref:3-isopropylmalate dehydrogenase n=1 Tax=Bacillus massiliigorillae TaxID=1243664 RepID=UPI0003A065F1|nr:3-isopropylmalate dehydrogenase [Bacillus massiliigorillae]